MFCGLTRFYKKKLPCQFIIDIFYFRIMTNSMEDCDRFNKVLILISSDVYFVNVYKCNAMFIFLLKMLMYISTGSEDEEYDLWLTGAAHVCQT